LAIVMVLVHHVAQMWPVPQRWLIAYTHYGALGVDLFFVLSGWLIGGIFWKEARREGSVRVVSFWSRRWFRTVPPYLVGLALAWGAVALTRSQPFDLGYLLFLQNYYGELPFFLVSWSLCVEEHFYLFIPLVFAVVYFWARRWTAAVLLLLAALPSVSRLLEFSSFSPGFGYYVTATHLRADGLMLGFLAAWMVSHQGWRLGRRWRVVLALVGIAAVPLTLAEFPARAEYVLEPLIVAVGFLAFLLAGASHAATRGLAPAPVRFLAFTSYSIYLTHALVIHLCLRLFGASLGGVTLAYLVLEVGAILFVGWMFYRLVELPSMRIRERLVPGRQRLARAAAA
jgi:peptidoglycan/LPS O-acetylase OafA/YrhL